MSEEELLEHFKNPNNYGRPEKCDLEIKGLNVSCGDYLTLFVGMDRDRKKVERLSFESSACSVCVAATSVFTNWANSTGLEIKDLWELNEEKIFELLGFKPSMSRIKCCTLCIKTLKKGVSELDSK
jgi:nitrogen fixation NifU-like protein